MYHLRYDRTKHLVVNYNRVIVKDNSSDFFNGSFYWKNNIKKLIAYILIYGKNINIRIIIKKNFMWFYFYATHFLHSIFSLCTALASL